MRTDTMRAPTPRAQMPAYLRRRMSRARCSMGLSDMVISGVPGRIAAMHDGEHSGYEEECGYGCEQQTADDREPERLVLLAALAHADGHREHANHHGQRGHEHRTEAGEAGLDRSEGGIAGMLQAFAREAHHQDAVGGGDAHTHDGAG